MRIHIIAAFTLALAVGGSWAHAQPEPATTPPTGGEGAEEEPTDVVPEGSEKTEATQPTAVVDFGEEEGFGVGEVMTTQDPTPLKHESLIRKKFRGPDAETAAAIAAASAPVETPSPWSLGAHIGVGMASFQGADSSALDSGVGASLGGFARYDMARHFALQPELRFSLKGALPEMSAGAAASVRLTYIEVPILAALQLPLGATVLSGQVGPALGVALPGRIGDADVERFQLSGVLGVSARRTIGAHSYVLDARYEYGLTSVLAGPAGSLGTDIHNSVFSLGLGFGF